MISVFKFKKNHFSFLWCYFFSKIVRGMNNKLTRAKTAKAAKENDDDKNNDISEWWRTSIADSQNLLKCQKPMVEHFDSTYFRLSPDQHI